MLNFEVADYEVVEKLKRLVYEDRSHERLKTEAQLVILQQKRDVRHACGRMDRSGRRLEKESGAGPASERRRGY